MITLLVYVALAAAEPAAAAVPSHGAPADAGAPSPSPSPGASPAPASPDEERRLEEQIASELGRELGAAPRSADAPALPGAAGGGQLGGNPLGRLMLLPDLSAVGSAALAWNHLDVEALSPRGGPFAPPNRVEPIFEELELGIQAVVDPYARADAFISFSPEGASVEEAYLTTLTLPAHLQLRAGQLYAPFGRINVQHPHAWTFVDRPLALARLLAVDGLGGPGAELSWLAPVPWFAELRVAYQAVTPAFDTASHVGGLARLAQFFELGPWATLGVGVSGGYVDEDGIEASRELLGGDVVLRFRRPDARSYLAVQAEALLRRLQGEEAGGAPDGGPEPAGTDWGGYVQAVYRDGPYLLYGARYERAPALGGGDEHRVSALLSWMRSEFERVRLQLSYDRLPDGRDGVEAVLGLEFSVGAHGAHPF